MRTACSTSAWRGDLEHALSRVKSLGFEYVDLICIAQWGHVTIDALAANYTGELERVRRLLSKYELTPIAANLAITPQLFERGDPAANAAREEHTRLFCRLMNDLGIAKGSYYPGVKQKDADYESIYAATIASVREIAAVAAEHSVVLGPELHWNTNVETLEQSRRLLEELPDLTIAYDPSHFIMQGEPVEATAFLLDRAHHVHLRSAAVDAMQAPLPEAREAIRWILSRLREIDYRGDLTIEYLPSEELDSEAEIAALRDLIAAELR